jgi:transcriptional regulator with XRE-family HTH domain
MSNSRTVIDGNKLYVRRIEAGLSQDILAELAGVSQTLISQIERGVCGTTPDKMPKFAAALGCNVRDLMPDELVTA